LTAFYRLLPALQNALHQGFQGGIGRAKDSGMGRCAKIYRLF
jgi:hypothetical protein